MEALTLFFKTIGLSIVAIAVIIALRHFHVLHFRLKTIRKIVETIIEDTDNNQHSDESKFCAKLRTEKRVSLMSRLEYEELFFSTKPLKASSWYTEEEMEFLGLNK